jgi:hypothetical protein
MKKSRTLMNVPVRTTISVPQFGLADTASGAGGVGGAACAAAGGASAVVAVGFEPEFVVISLSLPCRGTA